MSTVVSHAPFPSRDAQLRSLPPSTGESCPENGRSPGSVSTQHSSPRSDFTYSNSTSTTQAPNNGMSNTAATSDGTSTPNTQPNDVTISRKESEGFGFVIISSLNRPETAATNSEFGDCRCFIFSGYKLFQVLNLVWNLPDACKLPSCLHVASGWLPNLSRQGS